MTCVCESRESIIQLMEAISGVCDCEHSDFQDSMLARLEFGLFSLSPHPLSPNSLLTPFFPVEIMFAGLLARSSPSRPLISPSISSLPLFPARHYTFESLSDSPVASSVKEKKAKPYRKHIATAPPIPENGLSDEDLLESLSKSQPRPINPPTSFTAPVWDIRSGRKTGNTVQLDPYIPSGFPLVLLFPSSLSLHSRSLSFSVALPHPTAPYLGPQYVQILCIASLYGN